MLFFGIGILVTTLFFRKSDINVAFSLLALLGGLATICFTLTDLYPNWSAYNFFIGTFKIGNGNHDEPLMFFMHYWMVLIALNNLIWINKITRRQFILVLISISVYALYIFLVSHFLKIETHVTAIVKGDFVYLPASYYQGYDYQMTEPSYSIFMKIFHTDNWVIGSISAWISFAIIVILMILIKNGINKLNTKKNHPYLLFINN